MSEHESSHLPLKLTLKFLLNVALVWAMSTYVGDYFALVGGIRAFVVVGALISLLNIFFRPILNIITLPLRFVATLGAIMLVNGAFVWVIEQMTARMDPALVQFDVTGGPWGWIVVSCCFGLANWVMKEIFR